MRGKTRGNFDMSKTFSHAREDARTDMSLLSFQLTVFPCARGHGKELVDAVSTTMPRCTHAREDAKLSTMVLTHII